MTLKDSITFYDILDISSDASPQEVRDAYVRIKSTYNRDSVALYTLISPEEREETLKQIEEAYIVLSDPQKRRNYDQNYGILNSSDNPFNGIDQTPPPSNVVSIDRVPPMENVSDSDCLLIPPATDFRAPSNPPSAEPIPQGTPPATHLVKDPVSIKLQPQGSDSQISQVYRARTENRSAFPELDPTLLQNIESEADWRGSFLRKVRDAYQISLEEMATITKLTKTYIHAIEEENYARLPAAVYIRGFVIQIAKVLKLPHEKVASAYLSRYHRSKQ
jgi:curved DNA-binding protein CbpA